MRHACGLDTLECPCWKSNHGSYSCKSTPQHKKLGTFCDANWSLLTVSHNSFAVFGWFCFLNAFVSSVRHRHSRYGRCFSVANHIANGRHPFPVACRVNNTGQQNLTFFFGTRGKKSNPNRTFNAEFKCVSGFSPSPTVCL